MLYVLDAHPFLWYLAGSSRLGPRAKAALQDPASELVLPAVALAEACWIVERGRIDIGIDLIFQTIDADSRVTVVSLDRLIVQRSNSLTTIGEMHDRQIVATALLLRESGADAVILTRDENITSSGLVPVLW
jgi:PIN domain nuclease of toxin-antitoxin system